MSKIYFYGVKISEEEMDQYYSTENKNSEDIDIPKEFKHEIESYKEDKEN